jgi:hypothetical protein
LWVIVKRLTVVIALLGIVVTMSGCGGPTLSTASTTVPQPRSFTVRTGQINPLRRLSLNDWDVRSLLSLTAAPAVAVIRVSEGMASRLDLDLIPYGSPSKVDKGFLAVYRRGKRGDWATPPELCWVFLWNAAIHTPRALPPFDERLIAPVRPGPLRFVAFFDAQSGELIDTFALHTVT